MRHGRDVRKRRSSESYKKLITQNLTKLATNYRVELFKEEIDFFLDKLVSWTDYQIQTAFDGCLKECLFFPKLKEVLERMPEDAVFKGPVETCPHCEPDGWRLIISPTAGPPYRAVTRCDHKPTHPFDIDSNNPLHDFKRIYADENLPEWVKLSRTPGLHKTERPPRFPHLIGKGIKYGNVSTRKPNVPEKTNEPPTQK